MTEERIAQAFEVFIERKGLQIADLSLSLFPQLLIDYYNEVRFEELVEEEDGDLLLFQYGVYDWGEGSFFEVDFTRQFYETFSEGDDHEILQQQFTFYFDAKKFADLPKATLWSHDCGDLESFENAVTKSLGYELALLQTPYKFELRIEDVC